MTALCILRYSEKQRVVLDQYLVIDLEAKFGNRKRGKGSV